MIWWKDESNNNNNDIPYSESDQNDIVETYERKEWYENDMMET